MKNQLLTVTVFDEAQVAVHGPPGSEFLAVFTGPDRLANATICVASFALMRALEFATSENCATLEGWEEFRALRDAALRDAGVKS